MKNIMIMTICFASFGLFGCANDPELGISVSQLRAEQTLNPEAWYENLGYLPEGSGQRTQTSLEVYDNNGVAKDD
ncbi:MULTISPECIES: hypothetical protein [Vibrio]|uniref:Uncharacterized protein n=2 Tax=Vibrio campbellii TaxID=680 RepID=A0AAQ3B1H9_9VIBR|nr:MULTISPECIES: hypothetical protein [Vibrio]APX05272.1 hypothetical protein BWP24_03410 [Vibrio campbellii]AQM69066.1 hypothetical protein Vca1114GL_02634 [Vibrio campbellii]ARR43624.1 hypothetical protein CAY59_04275 [Vibrio campbellii]AYO10230.1 hypothetical protein D0784_12840 [Vibrio campbellii]KGR33842.1 hypothetical protein OA39_03786 [Vibrio campbellii]